MFTALSRLCSLGFVLSRARGCGAGRHASAALLTAPAARTEKENELGSFGVWMSGSSGADVNLVYYERSMQPPQCVTGVLLERLDPCYMS